MISRYDLDKIHTDLPLKPVMAELEDTLVVHGCLGMYQMYASKTDKSLTPCLTGEVGGMPGAWENWVVAWHLNNLKHFDTYVDVGANIGYFSFLAASLGKSVIAIEANPKMQKLLRQSAQIQYPRPDLEILDFGVSDCAGRGDLTEFENFDGSTAVRKSNSGDITLRSLNWLLYDRKPGRTLIKMDIEGSEELAFDGASWVNENIKPTYVLEWTPRAYSPNFERKLKEYGQMTVIMDDGSEGFISVQELNDSPTWKMVVVRPHG